MTFIEDFKLLARAVRDGKAAHVDLVRALRSPDAGVQGGDWLKRAAKTEIAVFSPSARQSIDRILPAPEGLAPSTQAINADLVNFLAVTTANIRLRARAGSGKSTALILKADHLITALGVAPEAIHMMTFNRKASQKLRADLTKAIGPRASGIKVSTFHAFALAVLKADPATAHLTPDVPEEDEVGAVSFGEERARQAEISACLTPADWALLEGIYRAGRYDYMLKDMAKFRSTVVDFLLKAATQARALRAEGAAPPVTALGRLFERINQNRDRALAQSGQMEWNNILRLAAGVLRDTSRTLRAAGYRGFEGQLRFLFVDEFQDFSIAFADLVQATLARNPDCVLNAVGDDWQAINGFMGADLGLFKAFKTSFAPALNLPLPVNWRCGSQIVALGNRVMVASKETEARAGKPHAGSVQIKQGQIRTAQRWQGDIAEESAAYVLAQAKRAAAAAWQADAAAGRAAGSVVLIASRNRPYALRPEQIIAAVGAVPAGGRLEFSTAHSAKGKDWDHVIVLDATAECYPSEHPGNLLLRGLRDAAALKAEGQRLLYVAVTRAKQSLTLIAPTDLHPRLRA